MKKNLFTLIIILLVLTVLFFVFVLIMTSQTKEAELAKFPVIRISQPAEKKQAEAILRLSPQQSIVKQNKEFILDIELETAKDVYGVDVFLEYNPDLINFAGAEANSEIGSLVKSKTEYPESQIFFSVLAPAQKTFTGKAKIAALKFLAKDLGTAEIKFILDNSNVAAANGKDILGETQNAQVEITAD